MIRYAWNKTYSDTTISCPALKNIFSSLHKLLYHGAAVTTYEMAPSVYGPMIETTNRTLTALMDRGHRLLPVNYMGTVQAVGIDPETQSISAVSDIRKGGKPSGW